MKEYVIDGKVVNITLDNGKVVKASTVYLENMVKNLDIDMEEAVLTWLEDEEYLINEEQEELVEKTKGAGKVKLVGDRKERPAKKTQKERVVKANPTKEMVISEIAKVLTNFETDINIENKGKIITFKIGDNDYKIDLIEKRKPKKQN